MGLRGQDNHRTPGTAVPLLNPLFAEQGPNMFVHDAALKYTIPGLTTTRRLRAPGGNTELEAENRSGNTGGVEAIPVLMNQLNKASSHIRRGWGGKRCRQQQAEQNSGKKIIIIIK